MKFSGWSVFVGNLNIKREELFILRPFVTKFYQFGETLRKLGYSFYTLKSVCIFSMLFPYISKYILILNSRPVHNRLTIDKNNFNTLINCSNEEPEG